MPKRKKKKYNKPRKAFDKPRIEEENILVKKYGLKNKREIWKADFAIEKIRNTAKKLITAPEEEKEKFITRQQEKGFEVKSIADILGLDKEDYLKRRLQSIVVKKEFAKTPKQARQLITHKHVTIKGNYIDSPSHITSLEEEKEVELKLAMPSKKPITKKEEEILKEIKEQPKKEERSEEKVKEEKEAE